MFDRRQFVRQAGTLAGATLLPLSLRAENPDLHLAPFRFDVTPPKGHSLCGGWIQPVTDVDDRLEAIGFVLLGAGKPVVICAVDWTGILNTAHLAWRTALAEAAGTTPDRVAVQCVHQHNAPFACLDAQSLVSKHEKLPHIVEVAFFDRCLDAGRDAIQAALKKPTQITHVATGRGKVEGVASNRRVFRDENGNVKSMRGSSCRDPKLRAQPEGLIDPWLKTIAFFHQDRKVAACHYYATHPMSYYGDGRVSADFVGLARKEIQRREPECVHLYFTGCAGNVAAGKYNDGTKPMRKVLTDRMLAGMVVAGSSLKPEPIASVEWATTPILPKPNMPPTADQLQAQVDNEAATVVNRNRPSYQLAWHRRFAREEPIILSALHVNDVTMLHLPAESFIEYQVRAGELASDRFVAVAAYGDGGPWYIPTAEEYRAGGYEVSVAFCDSSIDPMLTAGMKRLLGS